MREDREGTSRKSIRACFINGGKGTVVERDWKVGCKKGKKLKERQALRGEKDDQVVTVKSCFGLASSRLDRRYNRENVAIQTDQGFREPKITSDSFHRYFLMMQSG